MSASDGEGRPLTPGMRWLLVVATVLVALAGIQLFVFAERTERFFAWTIDPPLTAAFLGAAYWSSVAFEWSASRRREWSEARIAVPTVLVFTVLTLAVTLLHLDRFHLGDEFEVGTRLVTWGWIVVYATVPVLMTVIWARQSRTPGTDAPRALPLPGSITFLVGTQAVVLAVVGIGLLVAPERIGEVWPWPLTALTGRAIGAWTVSLAVAAVHAILENDLHRLRPASAAYLAFGILQFVALARFPDDLAWETAAGVAYVAFLVLTLVIGGMVVRATVAGAAAAPPPE